MQTSNPLDRFLSGIDIDRVKEKTAGGDGLLGDVLDSLGIDYYDVMVVYEQLSDRHWGTCPDCHHWQGEMGEVFVMCECDGGYIPEWYRGDELLP